MNRKLRKLRPEKAALRRCPFIPSQIVRNLQSYHFPTWFKGKLSGKPMKTLYLVLKEQCIFVQRFSLIYLTILQHLPSSKRTSLCKIANVPFIDLHWFPHSFNCFLANCNKLPECKTINIHQYSWNSHDSPYVVSSRHWSCKTRPIMDAMHPIMDIIIYYQLGCPMFAIQ